MSKHTTAIIEGIAIPILTLIALALIISTELYQFAGIMLLIPVIVLIGALIKTYTKTKKKNPTKAKKIGKHTMIATTTISVVIIAIFGLAYLTSGPAGGEAGIRESLTVAVETDVDSIEMGNTMYERKSGEVKFQKGNTYSPSDFTEIVGNREINFSCYNATLPLSYCEVENGEVKIKKDFIGPAAATCDQNTCKVLIASLKVQ